MPSSPLQSRVEALRRLTRRNAGSALKRTLEKSRPEDIAAALTHLAPAEQRILMGQIEDVQQGSDVLSQLDEREISALVAVLEFPVLLRFLERMEADDLAYVIGCLPEELAPRVLAALKGEEKERVEDLLAWPPDSAGGMMQPVAFRVNEATSCREAIEALQTKENVEMVFYLYAENDAEQLVGVTSLRNLLTHPASTRIADIMTTEVITVNPLTDQEEVARTVSRYGLLAVPVVDENRRLLGIVTVDDVVDVIKEEAAEDMLLMAGMDESADVAETSTFKATRQRLPWLLITMLGGMVSSEVISRFQPLLAEEAALITFIPVMMGMGGNVGIQAATLMVRNLATGRASNEPAGTMVFRELRIGALIGVAFALLVGGFAALRHGDAHLGGTIALAGVAQLATSATFGTLVPLGMSRVGVDPAVATGPFVTTGIDMLALLIYFSTCIAMLSM